MRLLDTRRLMVAILGLAACGVAAAADPTPYFGVKGGIMSSDRNGYDDSWNAGGVLGLHFFDIGGGKAHYGSVSGEVEATVPLVKGDINPGSAKWHAWTVGAFAVYRSPEANNVYFKGKAGAVHRNLTSSPGGFPGTGSSDDPAVGVGVGYRINRRNSIEAEVTLMDTLTFFSVGLNF